MNTDELIGYTLVVLAGLAMCITLCAMLGQCIQNCSFLRAYRRDLVKRVNGLRIRKMLARLGMSAKGYVRKALYSDVEMSLVRCERCPTPQECDRILARGDAPHPKTFGFCPNFPNLAQVSPRSKRSQWRG